MKSYILCLGLLMPTFVFAHGTTVQMASASTTAALEKFESEEAAAAAAFSGVKTWLDGTDAKVRIYYNDNADSIYYTCVMHHSGGEEHLMCTKD